MSQAPGMEPELKPVPATTAIRWDMTSGESGSHHHFQTEGAEFLQQRRSKAPFKSSPGDPEDDDEEDYRTGASLRPRLPRHHRPLVEPSSLG
jgi:hypothetical protein